MNVKDVVCFVAAGTRGTSNINGLKKPFLVYGNKKTSLEHKIDCLLSAGINKIIVWGDESKIKNILRKYPATAKKKIFVSPEQGSLAENFQYAITKVYIPLMGLPFFKGNFRDSSAIGKYAEANPSVRELPVILTSSDDPLATPYEFERFIKDIDARSCDYAAALTRKQSYELMMKELSERFEKFRLKGSTLTNFFFMGGEELRISNKHFLKPFKVDPVWWDLVQNVYSNRYLGRFTRRFRLVYYPFRAAQKMRRNDLLKGAAGKASPRSYLANMFRMITAIRWLKVAKRKKLEGPLVKKSRFRNSIKNWESMLCGLTGLRCKGLVYNSLGGFMDVDDAASYDFVRQHFNELKRYIFAREKLPLLL